VWHKGCNSCRRVQLVASLQVVVPLAVVVFSIPHRDPLGSVHRQFVFDQGWEPVFEEAISPDAFGVEDVAQGFEDAAVGGAEVADELISGESGADCEELLVGPGRVIDVREQELPGG